MDLREERTHVESLSTELNTAKRTIDKLRYKLTKVHHEDAKIDPQG